MLFNSGNRALLATTRRYAGDPSTAANPRLTDQQWKDEINTEYLELRDLVRIGDEGWCRKRAYATGVAVDDPSDHFYSLPADFVGRLRVEISTLGADLSTTLPGSDASIQVLTPAGWDVALDHYNLSNGTSDIQYVFMHDQHFGISTPLTATEAGTNSIRLTYEASTTELSGDTDEPDLPRPHHNVIALGAALRGNLGDGLDIRDLERRYEGARARLLRAVRDRLADYESTIRVSGLPFGRGRISNVGKVKR